MRGPAFVYTLLGSATLISAVDYAPGQDTWCMTYLSTYLVPISNQANSPAFTKPAEEPGRQPIAPSLKPTFAANVSTQRTQASFNTELPTSILFPEFSGVAELSSDGPELSTLDTEPTVARSDSVTQSFDPMTEPEIDQAATSSLSTELGSISTDAIPTSSGFVEPAGRSVIFRISVLDNQKRSTNKRQTIGGFVGNDNPQSCTFAATFNLAEGQLFEDGTPIYYSGESYKELSGLDFPSSGSITQTFEDTGRLAFRNSGLPNGRAGFCQTPDGIVYVTFTNGPVGCISVELVVYDVTQCQDGQLIGDDDKTATPSETVPQDTAKSRETDASMTSVVEDATTVRVSYSFSDFMTQSEVIGTSLTSDLGASGMISSETTLVGSTLADSTTLGTIIAGATATDTATIDTTTTDTTIVDTTISDGVTTDTATTDITVTETTIIDTTSLTTNTFGVDITTGVTTDITTTAAGTATADTPATSSGAPDTDCIKTNSPYTASNGVSFTLSCNTFIDSIGFQDAFLSDFNSCLQACSEAQACVGVSYLRDGPIGSYYCYLASYFFPGTRDDDNYWDVAVRDPVIADTTTGATGTKTTDIASGDPATADVPTGDTATSAAPTETSGPSACEDLSSPVQVDGDIYDIFCNTYRYYVQATIVQKANFLDCIQACSDRNGCLGVDYDSFYSECYLVFEFYRDTVALDGLSFAIRQGA